MTITTAKAVRAAFGGGARPLPLAAPVAMLALLLAPAARAEVKFTPGVELRETYTDNVNLEADQLARSQFISEVSPSLSVVANSPRLKLKAAAQLHAYAYSDQKVAGTSNSSRQLQASGVATLLDETLFVDGASSISQQSISAFGPQINNNPYADANRSEVKTYRLSPYLRHRFGAFASAELRYAHDLVSSDLQSFGRSTSNTAALTVTSGAAFHKVGWSVLYNRNDLDDSIARKSTSRAARRAARTGRPASSGPRRSAPACSSPAAAATSARAMRCPRCTAAAARSGT